jgi:hypothetical protein
MSWNNIEEIEIDLFEFTCTQSTVSGNREKLITVNLTLIFT